MAADYLSIYAFTNEEREILNKNENIITEKVKLSSKDIRVYFYLKACGREISITDLVRKCLIDNGRDVNSKEMYKPRKKPNSDEFYETGSFWGEDEYRVDTFSRSMSKLIKVGLVIKKRSDSGNVFETVVK